MNCMISIVNRSGVEPLLDICRKLELPLSLVLHGRGTASKKTLDLLGIESKERRVVMTIAAEQKADQLIREQKRVLYIDAPGNGIVISIPVKSVGGGRTLSYLSGDQPPTGAPNLNVPYELILAIANEGCTDLVMDAARSAGAAGGTILHGKGTGSAATEKFFGLSIAQEKELIMIVSRTEQKAAIMKAILEQAGPGSDAGAIVFSLPVTKTAGFSLIEDHAES